MANTEQPSTSAETKNEINTEYNPKLDFFSDEFDPLEALKSEQVKLPCPDARVYDNLASWNQHKDGQTQKNPTKKDKDQTTGQRRWLAHQLPVASTKHIKKSKNIFTKMEEGDGVFKALRKYKDEKSRIKIVTRDDRGIRGYCIATLLAFDKHWNLLLKDIDEVWTRRKKYKIPVLDQSKIGGNRVKNSLKPPKVEVTNSGPKNQECRRFIQQMVMRGQDVVMVTPVDNNSAHSNEELESVRQKNEEKSAFREKLSKIFIDNR